MGESEAKLCSLPQFPFLWELNRSSNNKQTNSSLAYAASEGGERNSTYHSMMVANAQGDDLICSSKSWFGSQNGHWAEMITV